MSSPGTELEELAPQQYMDIYEEPNAPLADLRNGALRLILYLTGIFSVVLIVLSLVVTIPRDLRLPFVLKGSTQERIYRFPDNVYIDRMFVRLGNNIRKGEPLVGISSPRAATLVAAWEDALRKRGQFEHDEIPVYESKKEDARLRQRRLSEEIDAVRAERDFRGKRGSDELRALTADAEQARRQYESRRQLYEAGSVSEIEMHGAEATSTAAAGRLGEARTALAGDLAALDSRERQLAFDRDAALESIASLDAESAARRAALENDVAGARSAIELNYGSFRVDSGRLDLVAPADGVVSMLFDGERELPAGSILLKLVAGRSNLYAYTDVPPQVVGYVRPGEPIAFDVATFPHAHWGVARGTVAQVSLAPNEKGEYPLQASIADAGRIGDRLRIGMTGEMSIVVEERSLFALLFEKVADVLDVR